MSKTAVVLFTRDLRVHDNPTLRAAAEADRVVPLFVLDTAILESSYNRPNRATFLAGSLADLDASLRSTGSRLHVRRGRVVEEVATVAAETGAEEVHVAADHSGYAQRRRRALTERLEQDGRRLVVHDSLTVVAPGVVTPVGKPVFSVFTPYFRKWAQHSTRPVLDAPDSLTSPRLAAGDLPTGADLCAGDRAPELLEPGETAGRRRMEAWLDGDVTAYADHHDDLPGDRTSRLSAYLHLGCLSPTELAARAGRSEGAQAFVRQLCWRDFHLQLLADRPELSREDLRPRGDRWRQGGEQYDAWRVGGPASRSSTPVCDSCWPRGGCTTGPG